MGRKRTYKTTNIKSVLIEQILPQVPGGCIVSVDVAKQAFVFAIASLTGATVKLLRFEHPTQTTAFFELLEKLKDGGSPPTVLFEPTGTYGDVVRAGVFAAGHPVFMVQPKHTHDARELIDGVPSSHDPKACVTMVFLHVNDQSRAWKPLDDHRRAIKAVLSRHRSHAREVEQRQGMLEAVLQTHWPEFSAWLNPREHRSGWALLQRFPSPRDVAADERGAAELLRRASRNSLSPLLIAGLIESAKTSLGVPMLEAERELMRELVSEIERHERVIDTLEEQLKEAMRDHEDASELVPVIGVQLAAAIWALLGSPKNYDSAGAIVKAAGLNLRITQSGTMEGGLHITKRGPALVRQLLYMAALRLINTDPVACAWYQARTAYKRDDKTAAVVALVRKYLRGIWAACRSGERFDTHKLFDVRRLALADDETRESGKRTRPAARTTPRGIARRSRGKTRSVANAGGAQ